MVFKFACKYFERDKLLAACDEEVLGKKLKYGEVDIEIKKSFYFEKFCSRGEIKKLMEEAKIMNLFGNKIIEVAIEQGLIKKENVKIIEGIAHVQIYRI